MGSIKVTIVVGTRPEAIKMAPVYFALQRDGAIQASLLSTAQHRQLLDQVLSVYRIVPDIDLNLMRPNQGLPGLSAAVLAAVQQTLAATRPDVVLVHGDRFESPSVVPGPGFRCVDIVPEDVMCSQQVFHGLQFVNICDDERIGRSTVPAVDREVDNSEGEISPGPGAVVVHGYIHPVGPDIVLIRSPVEKMEGSVEAQPCGVGGTVPVSPVVLLIQGEVL